MVGQVAALFQVLADDVRDVHRLVLLVLGGVHLHLVALAVVGPQGLALALGVVLDDAVGGVQDVGGGAVVLFQPDGLCPGVALFKLKNPFSEFFRRFFQTDSRCGTSVCFCCASPGPVTRSPCRSFRKVSDCRKHRIIRRPQQLRRFRRQTAGGSLRPYDGFQPFPGIRYALHNVIYMTDSHFSHFV